MGDQGASTNDTAVGAKFAAALRKATTPSPRAGAAGASPLRGTVTALVRAESRASRASSGAGSEDGDGPSATILVRCYAQGVHVWVFAW